MKTIILILLVLAISMVSCNSSTPTLPSNVRVKVLENSTITNCILSEEQRKIYRPLDTVWLNLDTHTIDDTSDNTMKAVLYETK